MIAICTWCGSDAYVEDHDVAADIALCVGPGHPEARMFEPRNERQAAEARSNLAEHTGIAAEFGLYDDLPLLLAEGEWRDTVVIEYLYAHAHPENYAWMLERWGHVAQSPRKYSTTSYIGSTLGHLSRAQDVEYKSGPATGFFEYNPTIGYWTPGPVPGDAVTVSWHHFATALDMDPQVWPLAEPDP